MGTRRPAPLETSCRRGEGAQRSALVGGPRVLLGDAELTEQDVASDLDREELQAASLSNHFGYGATGRRNLCERSLAERSPM
mgnify:CR=1 FL=1